MQIINIDLDNKYEFISEYNDNMLNNKLREYLLENLEITKDEITLKFNFKYQESTKKINIKKILNNSFNDYISDINNEIKRINIRNIIFSLLGIFNLAIYSYLNQFDIFLISEFCLIISWVVYWEIIESFLFTRRKFVINKKKSIKLINAKIEVIRNDL